MKNVCPSTITRGNVTGQFHAETRETERQRERDAQIDYHKESRALGGYPPKGQISIL